MSNAAKSLPLDDDEVADQYELATEMLSAAGYEQYELSNWARPGHQSRHNRTYWTDGDYIGIGAGAHGYLNRMRYENVAHPREYIAAVNASTGSELPALKESYVPDESMAMSDWLALRLRLIVGFEPSEFADRFGVEIPPPIAGVLHDMSKAGVVDMAPSIRLTSSGRLLHGEVVACIIAALQKAA